MSWPPNDQGGRGRRGSDPSWAAATWSRSRDLSIRPLVGTRRGGHASGTYRLDGLLATQAFPASITETLAYDAAKRPLSISLGAAGSLSQAFDRAGNVTSDGRSLTGISGDAGGNTQTFSYDGLSRLLGSSGLTASTSYEYDLDGNRTKRVEGATTTTFTYDRVDQVKDQVIAGTTRAYSYDAYGNLTQSADKNSAFTTYAFDEANRLTTITPPAGGAITFTMDALSRHATRLVGGTTTDTYSYLDTTETAWQTGTGGSPTNALLDVDGSRLAVKTGSTVSWLLFDLHGSVVAICTSGTSTLTDAYRFDGWGQQIASAGTATNPWRYRGLLNIGTDPGTTTGALLDMNARDYSPQLGTFTQQDSVQGSAANPAAMNRFLYAESNPATLIDPDGHMALATTYDSSYTSVGFRRDQMCHETTCGGTVKRQISATASKGNRGGGDGDGRGAASGGGGAGGGTGGHRPQHGPAFDAVDLAADSMIAVSRYDLEQTAREIVDDATWTRAKYLRQVEALKASRLPKSILQAMLETANRELDSAKLRLSGKAQLMVAEGKGWLLKTGSKALGALGIAFSFGVSYVEQRTEDDERGLDPSVGNVRAVGRAAFVTSVSTGFAIGAAAVCSPGLILAVVCGVAGGFVGGLAADFVADEFFKFVDSERRW